MSIDFLRLYERLFAVIPQGSLQPIMEIAYEETGLPTVTTDIMYNLLGHAPLTESDTGDHFWDYLINHHHYSTDMVAKLYEEGIMQTVNTMEPPYIVNWGAATEDFPKLLGVLKVNNNVEGYIAMQCQKDSIDEDLFRAMSIIQDACNLVFKEFGDESNLELANQKAFLNDLFSHKIKSQKNLEIWRDELGIHMPPPYRILTMSTVDDRSKNRLSYIARTMQLTYPDVYVMIHKDMLYLLQVDAGSRPKSTNAFLTTEFMENFGAYCGVSELFSDLLYFEDYLQQAEFALSYGKMSEKTKRFYFFKDFQLPIALSSGYEQVSQRNYLSPAITFLQKYDEDNQTDYLETLRVYIKSLENSAKTAAALHIHRNSLLYRLKKIEELTGCSLEDFETVMHLSVSFYMLDLK